MNASALNMVALIERKKRGEPHTAYELMQLATGYHNGDIPDYQMSAWLMAVCWQGMTEQETLDFTHALVASGKTLNWDHLPRTPVDKHSTGGVGDKTSLVLVPLMAAAGLPFVKMSGRGLGHTGGTLDKLESIPGLSVELSLPALREQIDRIGCALIGQSPELVPADGAIYALRDVTGTVNSIPLLASSIMSKKLASGAETIVLDVKHGSGAFLTEYDQARELAETMVRIGTGDGRRVRAVLSSMEQPLGQAIGNALEVREAIECLHGGGPPDLWELTLELGTHLLLMSGSAEDAREAREQLTKLRDSGAAVERFAALVRAQSGDARVVEEPKRLPAAPVVEVLTAAADGWVTRADARTLADAALRLGAGRRRKQDPIDLSTGVRILVRIGDRVTRSQPLAEIHAASEADARAGVQLVGTAITLAPSPPPAVDDRYEIIGD